VAGRRTGPARATRRSAPSHAPWSGTRRTPSSSSRPPAEREEPTVHTRRTIVLIVLAGLAAALAAGALLVVLGGDAGGWALLIGLIVVLNGYRLYVGPWHRRWGSTLDEARHSLPGDELLPGTAHQSDRAVTIDALPTDVWPWLVQLGWGRGGWYSYDWIDNDGHPSADDLDPRLQRLAVGDTILMTPDMGFTIRLVVPGELMLSQAPDGTTWCLRLTATGRGRSRLLSRFRLPPPRSLGAVVWGLLADPGAFLMERRMLLNLKARAEATAAPDGATGAKMAG